MRAASWSISPSTAGTSRPSIVIVTSRPRGDLQGLGAADDAVPAGSAITASNSSRNLRTIAPTGIAIESPSTQRQWPMMFCWTELTTSRSMGVASPRTIRSSIFTVQLVPSRQGTHLPQDSWW